MRLIGLVAILLIICLTAVISGCLCCSLPDLGSITGSGDRSPSDEAGDGEELKVITSAPEIDEALTAGPVLVKFGADWCGPCRLQEPILKDLAADYPSMTFLEVNTDDSPGLAREYRVSGIPHMVIIVRNNTEGKYVYVDQSGKTTTDRGKAGIIGLREYDELKPLVEKGIEERG